MSTLEQIRDGITKAWDSLTEGWHEFRELAGDALTRFHPHSAEGEDAAEGKSVSRSSRWGLLAAEVADHDKTVQVMIEAPGLAAEDFDIEVRDDILIVRGEKKVAREETLGHYHIMERAYGRFERAIRLPASVEAAGAEAKYDAGVLTINLPKSTATRQRRIAVTSS